MKSNNCNHNFSKFLHEKIFRNNRHRETNLILLNSLIIENILQNIVKESHVILK